MKLNSTLIGHFIKYICTLLCDPIQQLCHEFCFYEASNCSVFVDNVREVMILLYVYY